MSATILSTMEILRGFFRWLKHPQLLVCFVALCLLCGAFGSLLRSVPVGNFIVTPQAAAAHAAPVAVDCSAVPCISLTFDDGPSPDVTPRILDILAHEQVKATFFVVGCNIAGHESILRRAYADGHEIGNHSWDHPDLTMLAPDQVEDQLRATQRAVAASGVPVPRLVRPPYGSINEVVAAHNHLAVVRWNVDPEDWKSQDPALITEMLLAQVRPGSIILLHDIHPATAAAVEAVLPVLKQKYHLVTVSQLLNLTPRDQGQYFAR